MRSVTPTLLVLSIASTLGCQSPPHRARPVQGGGLRTQYEDPSVAPADGGGMGLEGQDYAAIADGMARSILAKADFGEGARPLVGISPEFFTNDSLQTKLDPGLFLDRLRTSLISNAMNRLRFVSLDSSQVTQRLRDVRDAGLTQGTRAMTTAVGVDFYMHGVLREQLATDPKTGMKRRLMLLTLSLVDVNNEIVWADEFVVQKAGKDDIIYH